jgi:hypothetical protein
VANAEGAPGGALAATPLCAWAASYAPIVAPTTPKDALVRKRLREFFNGSPDFASVWLFCSGYYESYRRTWGLKVELESLASVQALHRSKKTKDAVEATRSIGAMACRCFRCGGRPAFSRWGHYPRDRHHSNYAFARRRNPALPSVTRSRKPSLAARYSASNRYTKYQKPRTPTRSRSFAEREA